MTPACSTTSHATMNGWAWKVAAMVSPSRNSCTGSQKLIVCQAIRCTSGLELYGQTVQRPGTVVCPCVERRHEKVNERKNASIPKIERTGTRPMTKSMSKWAALGGSRWCAPTRSSVTSVAIMPKGMTWLGLGLGLGLGLALGLGLELGLGLGLNSL